MTEKENLLLIATLKERFTKHMHRHPGLRWNDVEARLVSSTKKIEVLDEMERTGGEPDVIGLDASSGEFIFCDCSPESPAGRRSLCYDRKALDSRKENKPLGSVVEMAEAIGITLLTEEEYRQLQTLDEFDKKTQSWISTPASIRELGGAVFCDRRYNQVFLYHNGAESYYASRGFRGTLRV